MGALLFVFVCGTSLDVVRADADPVGIGDGVLPALTAEVHQVADSERDGK